MSSVYVICHLNEEGKHTMRDSYQSQKSSLSKAFAIKRATKPASAATATPGSKKGNRAGATLAQPDLLRELLGIAERFGSFQLQYIEAVGRALGQNQNKPDINWAYNYTVRQVGADFDVITRIIAQREHPDYLGRLQVADTICEQLLKPAQDLGLCSSGVRVITYFNKEDLVRVVPYANIAFIGIPWQSLSYDWDLLAMAHELGHYIFWDERFDDYNRKPAYCRSGVHSDLPLYLKIKKYEEGGSQEYKEKYRRWIEEMCADIVGCTLARHFIAQSFVDISLNRFRDSEITQDDHEHPSPFIRPDIYVEVLTQLEGNPPSQITGEISKNWKDKIDARLSRPNDNQNDRHEREGTWAELKPKINDLHELYATDEKANRKLVGKPPIPPIGSGASIEDLGQKWSDWVQGIVPNEPKPLSVPYYNNFQNQSDWDEWQANLIRLYQGISDTNPGCDTCNINKALQITVFAGGWTEGPCCGTK